MATYGSVMLGGENIKIFPITTSGSASTLPTYGTKIDIEGFVSIDFTPEVSQNDFYADNRIFYSSKKTTKVTGTLNVAALPTNFYKNIYKFSEGASGELVETLGVEPVECALAFEAQTGDDAGEGGIRIQLYKVKFSKPAFNLETANEGSTVQPLSLTFTAFARKKDDRLKIAMPNPGASGSSTKKTLYAKFLTAVVERT